MVDFASCSELPDISDPEFCAGFAGCAGTGLRPTAANLNAILNAIMRGGDNANLSLEFDAGILSLLSGETPVATVEIPAAVGVPAGLIAAFDGGVTPVGWALCDGTDGTPDLRDKFVLGAGPDYADGTTGGTETHQHSLAIDNATTGVDLSEVTTTVDSGGSAPGLLTSGTSITDPGHQHTGQSNLLSHMPPFYALRYFMKL